jgi:alpha-tubulin suppressor-like RCC1 family protein
VYDWGNGDVTNVFTGNFNRDHLWDIGVTGTASESDRNWYIRYGDGFGHFSNQTVYDWGNGNVTNVFTGDFNRDGLWDIGVTGTASESDRNWYIRYHR